MIGISGERGSDVGRIVTERSAFLVAIITLFAFALRIYNLNARTLFGDEYNSILEAQEVGRNLQALLYFGIEHFWLLLGLSDFWVRFPSAVFGVLTVPVSYQFGRHAANRQTGLLLAILLALSSFGLEYSQETRHYSLFLLTTTLSLASFVALEKNLQSGMKRLAWIVTSILVIFSHLFGVLIPLIEIVVWWLAPVYGYKRSARAGLILSVLVGLVVLTPLVVNSDTFGLLERILGSRSQQIAAQARGLSIANLAKVPVSVFFFSLGQSVYPLEVPFSIIGVVVFGIAASFGLVTLRERQSTFMLVLAGLLLIPFVFLVLDPAAPVFSETASTHHVIMALPFYLLLVASGLAAFPFRKALTIGIGLVLVYSLVEYFSGSWSYTIPVNVDWRDFASLASDPPNSKTVVLYDGRSADPVDRYFDPRLTKKSYWPYLQSNNLADLVAAQTIVFVTNDFQVGNRQGSNRLLAQIEREFESTKGQVRYPAFEYAFERKTLPNVGYPFDSGTHEVTLPREIYGLEFQDLALPAQASFEGFDYPISGSFALPNLEGDRERSISFADAPLSTAFVMLSNVTGAGQLQQDMTIGELVVNSMGGGKQAFPLKLGNETQQWSLDCAVDKPCQSALAWRKRAALVGQRTYEGAWSDFQAKIFGVRLGLLGPVAVESITIRYLASSGQLNVWGIALR